MDGIRKDEEKDLLPAPADANLPEKDIDVTVAQTHPSAHSNILIEG